jgi:outer membrane protein with beta-barrel domain
MKIHLSITHLIMKKIILITTAAFFTLLSFAQDTPTEPEKKKDRSKISLAGRSNDHFLIQLGYAGWAGIPDSINTKGLSRSFNFYLMMDFPFKTDPRFSVALGPGVGTDHIFFDKTNITIADQSQPLRFQNLEDTNHFDKYKLVSAFLELPVELRFSSNPEKTGKSFKLAIGAKVGTLVDIHVKGKRWVNKAGTLIPGFGEKFVQKQKDKHFFNGNRLVGTARIGYGYFSLFGTYELGPFIKEGLGPTVHPFSIGITLSGL